MIRVLVADANTMSRKGWAALFAKNREFHLCADCSDPDATLKAIRSQKPDLVIIDPVMGQYRGIDFVTLVRRAADGLPLLVHTRLPEDQFGPNALEAGAAAFVPKTAPVQTLLEALRKAADGGKFITPALAEILATRLQTGKSATPHDTLSAREHQVFCLLATGNQVSQVAKQLSLSVKTISTFRARILLKLGIKTNAQITQYAFKHGLVD